MPGIHVGVLTCFSDATETILASIAGDFGGYTQVPQAKITLVALQSMAWDARETKEQGTKQCPLLVRKVY